MPNENWDEQFEKLSQTLGNVVGEGEIAARQFFGDDRFSKIVEMTDAMDEAHVKRERAQTTYLQSVAGWYNVLGISLLSAMTLVFAWSLYYWITN